MITAAALSESAYMLEFQLYRAVKLMQIIPIGAFLVGYLVVYAPRALGLEGRLRDRTFVNSRLRTGIEQPVRIRWAVLGILALGLVGVAGIVGLYYLARTGNSTSVGISSVELMLRNVLEAHLVARPRTKEFLIGVPCLILFIYLRRRGWKLLPIFVGIGMAIGLTSFVNTFLHIRSPLYLGFARTAYALLFGGFIGALCAAMLELLRSWWRRRWNV